MKKLRSSTKIGMTAVLLAIGGYYGLGAVSTMMIRNERFGPVSPGRVNLVGINPGAGYRIIIANDVAQLVETQGGFGGKEGGSDGPTEGSIKKRVPMREVLGVLRGDGSLLGPLVMKMNDQGEKEDWPPIRVDWTKANIDKAIAGDPKLKDKLERDLNVHLDGTPVVPLNRNSLENGIFIHTPVELTLDIGGKRTVVRGETVGPYKPSLIRATEAHYQDKANVDNAMIAGYYAEEAKNALENPTRRENVAKALETIVSKTTMENNLAAPRRILENATVVLNESFVKDASYRSYPSNNGKTLCDLTVTLTDEGRRRLWKYTAGKDRVGRQILLVADDVAISAPRIEHELPLNEFTVTQMQDESLVKEAVATIKASKTGPKVARE